MKALLTMQKNLNLVTDAVASDTGKDQVRVQVHYASLNPTDLDIAQGKLDLFLKLSGVRSRIRTGLEFSGIVIEDSTRFQAGDRVFGYTHLIKGPKTHQAILSIPEAYVARIPNGVGFAEAAALPIGGQTSLIALRDVAKLSRGQSLLVNGGSGGVGVFAIQIAKAMGLEVTAVSGPAGQDVMRDLGADRVVNYRDTPLGQIGDTFDALLDLSNTLRFLDARPLLNAKGMFVPVDPTQHISAFAGNLLRRQKVGYLYADRGNPAILADLAQQVADGTLTATHYQSFAFDNFQTAITAMSRGGKTGRTLLRLV